MQRSCADVNSPYQRNCWTNSGGPLINSKLWGFFLSEKLSHRRVQFQSGPNESECKILLQAIKRVEMGTSSSYCANYYDFWGEETAEIFLYLFWSKIAIYLSQGLYRGHLSFRRSLQPSKENIHSFKIWNFFPHGSGSEYSRPKSMQIHADPVLDPKRMAADLWRHSRLRCRSRRGARYRWLKFAIYLSLGLHKGPLSFRISLQPSKENIHSFKIWNFFPYGSGSEYSRPIITQIHADPDPKEWLLSADLWRHSLLRCRSRRGAGCRWPGSRPPPSSPALSAPPAAGGPPHLQNNRR
jgi:hypothetical protein